MIPVPGELVADRARVGQDQWCFWHLPSMSVRFSGFHRVRFIIFMGYKSVDAVLL